MTRRNPTPEQFAELSPGAQEWLLNGERGASSETLFKYATDIEVRGDLGDNYPADAADFRRCRLLLEAAPELASCLPRVAQAGSEWAALVNWWDDLCLVHDAENPDWREGFEKSPQTTQMIRDTIGR